MNRRTFLGMGGLLAGVATLGLLPATPGLAQYGAGQPAPEFVGLSGWLNTTGPITLAEQSGHVVLVDFWTYSCINCRRTIPYLNRWHNEYGPLGLRVISIHTPEFGFERMRQNVAEGVKELGIQYPVGQDNHFQTWRAWNNEAWPAFYILDRDGRVVLVREGEGYAHEMEAVIRDLLNLGPGAPHKGDDPDLSRIASPEMYFGSIHPTPQDRAQAPRPGEATYAYANGPGPRLNTYRLDGTWFREKEALVLRSSKGGLRMRFSAAKLHLVASAPTPTPIHIRVDGGDARSLQIEHPTLYTLVDGDRYAEHLVEVETDQAGLSLFSATFG
ncbi:MAG TPA: redoxin domain-containing protein [Rhodopila sp.]|nr:redoxin domain-containing protein [Rhodopila sp.]